MKVRPWDNTISKEDLEVYERAGFGRRGGLGQRPAILIIDVQYRTVGVPRAPIIEAMKSYATACGEYGWRAVDHIQALLQMARPLGVPIFYPYVSYKEAYDGGRFADKVPTIMQLPEEAYRFVAEVAPQPGDILLPKIHPSAFFGSPLVSYLIDQHIDTLLICGCTTSGCVRSTVTDAFAYNFRLGVIEECVYDRGQVSHAVNLFDIHSKYADVLPLEETCRYLRELGPGGTS